jgi:hypothetical protein
MVVHSNPSASVGFTAEARRAGMSAAPNVAAHKINVAAAIVAGSVGLMPYSCDSTRRPSIQTHGRAGRRRAIEAAKRDRDRIKGRRSAVDFRGCALALVLSAKARPLANVGIASRA